ncbi:hypothetical protein ASF70_15995 [Rhizobium sp. Leaf321]|uniref:hypothetical protein n=1 Tax=Rhizobium sp. Leaf321 TaxID=1736335 RepID=UPI000715ACBA|nr:hypothetical protein [Rhizobium sp. Leaf321]KQQ72965.1 hypothetical protein ASF70_15995 [Rhizobium sp. Leaf321]
MTEQNKQSSQPFAWYWYDQHGCLYITGHDRKPDLPSDAQPLYATEQNKQFDTPAPDMHVPAMEAKWQWWAGSTKEWCTVGPEDTREAIIQAATNDSLGEFQHEEGGWNLGFYIVEARQDPLRLADWIESDELLERAEESMADSDRTSSENDDGPWFECTQEQGKDLEERVKRACDEWQAAHGLKFTCSTFSHTRNQEHVIVEVADDRATTEGSR